MGVRGAQQPFLALYGPGREALQDIRSPLVPMRAAGCDQLRKLVLERQEIVLSRREETGAVLPFFSPHSRLCGESL
jgi:hypothetical protein